MNGAVAGLLIALLAVAFACVYRCARIFHFSLAGIYTLAPYLTWTLSRKHVPLWTSVLISIIVCSAISLLVELLNHRRLERRHAGTNLHLVSSLGIYLSLVSVSQLFWGNETRVLRTGNDGTQRVLGSVLTDTQLLSAVICAGVFIVLLILLQTGRTGLIVKGLASNSSELALKGANIALIRGVVFALSGALAGIAGNLAALDIGFGPTGGLEALLIGIVASIVSGNSLLVGTFIASVGLGVLRTEVVWLYSSRWQEALTFAILAIALLLSTGWRSKTARLEAQP